MKKKRGGRPWCAVGNKNAEKHGLYSRYLAPSPLDYLVADIILDREEKLTMERFLQVKQELINEWLNYERSARESWETE